MGDATEIIEDGIFVKIFWKTNVDKNEKRLTKEKIIQIHVGKLCVVYQEGNNNDYIATSIVTVIPAEIYHNEIFDKIATHYENKNYTVVKKEQNISISSVIVNQQCQPSLKPSIQIYATKRKILIQGAVFHLENFAATDISILESIGEKHSNGETILTAANKFLGKTQTERKWA